MLKQIVLATDYSDSARSVYPTAVALARDYGSKLFLVHACSPLPPFGYEEAGIDNSRESVFEELQRRLEGEAKREIFHGVDVEIQQFFEFSHHRRLVEFAERIDAGLIVLGTHGRTGLSHVLLGSFAEKTLRYSNVPVLTVRAGDRRVDEGFFPRHAIVPIDFSENAEAVFPAVRFLSERYGTRFTFVHVLDEPGRIFEGFPSVDYVKQRQVLESKAPMEAELRLAEIRDEKLDGVEVHFEMRRGVPYESIVDVARDVSADLILMSTHGHTGLKHCWLGSVAERVVRHSPCSVMTLRPGALKVAWSPAEDTAKAES